jgi:hypothetical protein
VGQLPGDAYYAINVGYSHGGEIWYDDAPWTKETGWAISEHAYLVDLADDGQFTWSVRVMRQTGQDAQGKPTGTALGSKSEERVFVWRGAEGGGGEGEDAKDIPP